MKRINQQFKHPKTGQIMTALTEPQANAFKQGKWEPVSAPKQNTKTNPEPRVETVTTGSELDDMNIDELRAKATELGLSFHHNIGANKLRELIASELEGTQ